MREQSEVLMELQDVVRHFPVKGGVFLREVDRVKAVNGVSFQIRRGETFGLVGESGCGKSTLGGVALGLDAPTSGKVLYRGRDLYGCPRADYRQLRQEIQVVFQDPYESLNPRMTVGELVAEGLNIRGGLTRGQIREQVVDMLEQVGLSAEHYSRFPHEFSGGQRQRIGIARALVVKPKFIVCDEPVSALDVSVQAQIINLLSELQKKYEMTYLFIAHGLTVVKYLCDRVGVMYLGQLVELADGEELFRTPRHPYTRLLLQSIPDVDGDEAPPPALTGDVPSPLHLPKGCLFHPRCAQCTDRCREERPELRRVGGALVRCHLYQSEKRPDSAGQT